MLAAVVGTVLVAGTVSGAPKLGTQVPEATTATACQGVVVVVDPGALPADGDSLQDGLVACALRDPSAPGTDGLDVLRDAGVQVEGTAQWGAAFVCRVEGRPASSETILVPDVGALQETCDRTPSALAYWTLWTAAPGGAWTYAQTGAGDMDLVPGAALGLVFAVGEDGPEPPSLSAGAARTGTATDGWTWRASSADDATSSGSEDAEGRRSRTSADTVLPVVGATLVVVLVLASLALARRRR